MRKNSLNARFLLLPDFPLDPTRPTRSTTARDFIHFESIKLRYVLLNHPFKSFLDTVN